ncbi:MAG: hypothetical protein B7Y89_10835 [Novosphingobium sp. 32-60-15]|uniref:acyltransferase n=1 Tax=unclassified Novosphingobium TaxID=2644732 RepID=UPI000BD5F977|nr:MULTISPECIES: DapH/DapD/GlmU-related protein [unclassified Novosphingobium]OYX61964.1 MAG: hypothetical protein B7Y89_10835 [Novosphingobium sp. 32-60-15]
MTIAPPLPTLDNTLQQKWQRFIQTHLWKMDIHPTTWIAPTALIDRTWPKGIHIAANCVIDHHAVVLTHDMTRGIYLDTHIGENTRIGARAIIMPGVTVGKYCVVEPGSVVTRDIPDGIRVIGNPAKDISTL